MMNTFRNSQSNSPAPQIKYPTTISPTRPPILAQQITTGFQLSEETWN